MSQFSKEISEWKENVRFYYDIWKLYEEFNQSADNHEKNSEIFNKCKEHARIENNGEETYNELCMKLLKNILILFTRYSNDKEIYSKRCKDLYNWLYHKTKPYKLTENIVPSIFNYSKSLIQETDKQYICPYLLYNKDHYKYEKIIELNIFEDNVETLIDILKDRNSDQYCPCIKYVNNCVKTYKNLDNNYCTPANIQKLDNDEFCKELNKFPTYYGYLTDVPSIMNEIPSLSSDIDKYTNECLSDNSINQLVSTSDKSLGNSTSVAASTVVGAMVGIPPFLALMYKFTPVGQLFRSRYYKGKAHNIGLNELFYPTSENMNYSSYHTGYNVLYGPGTN
ncbi:PIR protein [Plasmodium vivax]|uniref:VIR protein n=1 Tax=Plasmodium vivax TaxID=5855 RepID=A0A565A3N7_PLAVI|nr:PIR protein [Plasmodium vivax]